MTTTGEIADLLQLDGEKASPAASITPLLYVKLLQATLDALDIEEKEIKLDSLTEETYGIINSRILDAISRLKRHAKKNGLQRESSEKKESDEKISEWMPYAEDTHVPSFGIDSPVVRNVLSTWSDDEAKRDYFIAWAKSLKKTEGSGYPAGIQVTRVSKVLRDAFLMLVYPVLKQVCADKLVATVREHINIEEKPAEEVILGEGQMADLDMHLNSDPFITENQTTYDIRFKRVGHHSERSIQEDVHHSTEADNYSPLSEINAVFKELEHKAKEEMLAHELERQQRHSFSIPPPRTTSVNEPWTRSLTAWLTGSQASQPVNRRSSFSDFLHRSRNDPQYTVDSYGWRGRRTVSTTSGVPFEAGAMAASHEWFEDGDQEGPEHAIPFKTQPAAAYGGRSQSMDSGRVNNKNARITERLAALRVNNK